MAIRNNTSLSPNSANEAEAQRLSDQLRLWAYRHKRLTEIFLDAYCIVDTLNRVVDFNVAFTELCGESYRKILKTADFCELLRTEMCPGQCPARRITASQKALRFDELAGVTKAFPQLQMILGGVPIFSEDSEFLGSLITVRNVSAESELQKKYDERKKESIVDGPTRLFNKVYTESLLLRMVKTGQMLSVVMCDLDHFKHVNDTYGHRAGDHVLVTVSQLLKGETRDSDIVGRVGGEEFLAILPNSDQAGASIFADRFRKRVEESRIHFEGKHIPLTVSLGTASFLPPKPMTASAELTVKELIGRADKALYRAKTTGRNRVCQYETLPAAETAAGDK